MSKIDTIQVNGTDYELGGSEVKEVSITFTLTDLQGAINGFTSVSYTESDKEEIATFIQNQEGIIKLNASTPLGNLGLVLRPSLFSDGVNQTLNFEGSILIEVDLSTIGGGSNLNQIIVRGVNSNSGSVTFRPTIIPIL